MAMETFMEYFYNIYYIYYVIAVIVTVVSTIACPIIAHKKGRSAFGWFFGGWILGGLGLIIVSCLPEKR